MMIAPKVGTVQFCVRFRMPTLNIPHQEAALFVPFTTAKQHRVTVTAL